MIPDEVIIDRFVNRMAKRYPDSKVVKDDEAKEVRVVEEGLSYKYEYIVQVYLTMY